MGKTNGLTHELIRGVMRVASDAREYRHNPDLQQQAILDGLVLLVGGERPVCVTMTDFAPDSVPVVRRIYTGGEVDPAFALWIQQVQLSPLHDPLINATLPDLNA